MKPTCQADSTVIDVLDLPGENNLNGSVSLLLSLFNKYIYAIINKKQSSSPE